MPLVWLYWLGGGLAAWLYNSHVSKLAALQSIDASFLLVNASSQPQANQADASKLTTIQNPTYGAIKSEANVPQNYVTLVQSLSPTTHAPDWLVVATAAQSSGYPVLANSLSTLGMHLLENGQLGL